MRVVLVKGWLKVTSDVRGLTIADFRTLCLLAQEGHCKHLGH